VVVETVPAMDVLQQATQSRLGRGCFVSLLFILNGRPKSNNTPSAPGTLSCRPLFMRLPTPKTH
jgi:hypothetical protein